MEIDISNYLSNDEIAQICEEELRGVVRRRFDKPLSVETAIADIAYKTIWQEVDAQIGEDSRQLLAKKVQEVINELSPYSVFRQKGYYNEGPSVAQKMLDEIVLELRPYLKEKVIAIIDGTSTTRLKEVIRYAMDDAVREWLKEGED